MSPDKATANVLDKLVRGRDLIYSSLDKAYSLQEFAIGINLDVRDLDVCWGYASIEPKNASNYNKEAVIGIGVMRQDGDLLNIPSDESGLSLSSLLDVGGADALQNVYAFGSIFLQANTAPDAPNVVPLLLRGGANGTGIRLLINKDITLDEATDLILNGDVESVVPPAGDVLEIFRFILDITYYSSTESFKNRIQTHIFDMRKPRGWGGYAEENMGVQLIPAAITNYNNISESVEDSEKSVKDIISLWTQLTTWEPDFLNFWKKSGSNVMPERLERYLSEILGITLLT